MLIKLIKKIISKIDSVLFKGAIKNFYFLKVVGKKILRYRAAELNHGYVVQYMKNAESEINQLCDKYGSDKGETTEGGHPYSWPSHTYADFYESIFMLRKGDVKLVIECGLGSNNPNMANFMTVNGKPGASVRMWRDYFPKARVIGVDIDEDILFSEERIETFKCDQTNSDSIKEFAANANLNDETVDIIIDDGMHKFHAGKTFFEGMIQYLAPQGVYVIEDITAPDSPLYKDYFLNLESNYSTQFVMLCAPKIPGNNRLIVVRKK